MQILKNTAAELVSRAVDALFAPATLAPDDVFEMLEYPPDGAMGDLALPCFKLSKSLRRSPMEIAAKLARKRALENHPELSPEDIGVCFISPCPAKVSYVRNGFGDYKSEVDEVLSISDMSVVNNRVRLADVGMAVTLVKEWNASASGRALPASFIYPGSEKWFRFTQWCRTNRNVSIPDYRQG